MNPENLSENLSKDLPEDLSDETKGKSRRLSDVKDKLSKWFNANRDKLGKIRRWVIIWVISVAAILLMALASIFIVIQIEKQKRVELAPVGILEKPEETKEVISALGQEKTEYLVVPTKTQPKRDFFKKSALVIIFAIVFVIGVPLLCLYGLRFQSLRKWIKKGIAIVSKDRRAEDQLSEFKRLEDISFTLLGGLLLKGFGKMGYEVALSSGITSGCLTCVLKRENEKALFRYIICKEDDDFHQTFVEDFANSMEIEKASKGYLLTTGVVTEALVALAREKSIELAGKEKLVELIPSCLLQDGLMKKLEDSKTELAKQAQIAKDEMAEKQALSEKLKESQDITTKLNDEKIALSEEAKTKEEEYSWLLKKHEDIEKELQRHKEEVSSLVSERNRLQEEISRLRGKVQGIDEQLANYKSLEEQLSEKDKLLEDERSQRQQLKDKLCQSDKDMEEAMYLADDMEEKLAKKDRELSEEETALSKLQEESKNYVTEMEDEIFPSLDLTSLADKGVLLKVEPDGPIVSLKRIGSDVVSFESDRKLEVPSPCNITLIFFGSFNPLAVRGSLMWQKKLPGSSRYNVKFGFFSLKQNERDRINKYINETQKLLCEAKR